MSIPSETFTLAADAGSNTFGTLDRFLRQRMLDRLAGIELGHHELLDWIDGWLEETMR